MSVSRTMDLSFFLQIRMHVSKGFDVAIRYFRFGMYQTNVCGYHRILGVDACGFFGATYVAMHLLDTKGSDDSRAIWSGLLYPKRKQEIGTNRVMR